jgi:branched-chain amino acid transport system permease protein
VRFLGALLDAQAPDSWFGAAFVLLAGGGLFELVRRVFKAEWGDIQQQIEGEIKRRETAA